MPKLPDALGKYKITDRLGRGGMSVLYKGEHPTLGTPVVVKKLMLKGDPAHRERFRREAALMMDLRHENVVGVYDHFREGAGHYLVMEYVDGHSLAELLSREGALEPGEATWLMGKIAAALAHIHSHGVVHRDIKPSNILLSRDGTVKLADFGIAFTPGGGEDITAEGTALGTPSFMAPEQLEDARMADERSDVWSLGVCFFELLTGRKFVSGPSPAAIREALPEAVRTVGLRLPPSLPGISRRLVRRTLRMKPDSRLRDGGAVCRLIGNAAGGSRPPAGLQERLDGLMGSLDPVKPGEQTPEVPPPDDAESRSSTSDKVASIRSLFLPDRSRGQGRGSKNSADSGAEGKATKTRKERPADGRNRRRPSGSEPVDRSGSQQTARLRSATPKTKLMLVGIPFVILLSVATWFITPARMFARRTHGILRLELVFPESAPSYWLDGAEVRLFRERDDGLDELAAPALRPAGGGKRLASRRLSLPAGAYRLSWSLGDTVSWTSLRLPAVSDFGVVNGSTLLVEERLGTPPVFPLELEWTAVDAELRTGLDSGIAMSWERLDSPGGRMESGGRYRFHFEGRGYRPAYYDVAVSPWRRYLRLEASMWRLPGNIEIRNTSSRSAVPRIDGSGRYMNMAGAPRMSRIGRLASGESVVLILPPGDYIIAPGFSRDSGLTAELGSGDNLVLEIGEDGDGNLLIR